MSLEDAKLHLAGVERLIFYPEPRSLVRLLSARRVCLHSVCGVRYSSYHNTAEILGTKEGGAKVGRSFSVIRADYKA